MIVIHMSANGRLVFQKSIRDVHGLRAGSAFAIVQSRNGDLILRPVIPKPNLTLINHLRKFKGLEVPEIKAQVRPR